MSSLTLRSEHGITMARRRTAQDLLQDDGPYACLLNDLVIAARTQGASDIHIEPTEFGVDLRLRVDGNLYLEKKIELEHRESLILEAKRIFGLSIGISGKPQDGRAALPDLKLDLRVSLLPTHFGEKIVMRLLNLDATFELGGLGFQKIEQEFLESAIKMENGVIVISGPTGSGKSRTLYALLKAIGPARFNIVTLEDPIEYRIEGLNQVQVSKKMSFADALRSVLRQDPDVILVGEIRDAETAKLCFQAAETGHLVFTTLHANGAMEVVERLAGLGVDPLSLKSNLRFAFAQRLEPKLCSVCAVEVPEDVYLSTFREQVSEYARGLKRISMHARGPANGEICGHCIGGMRGRVPVLECAEMHKNEETGEDEMIVVRSLEESRWHRIFQGETECEGFSHEPERISPAPRFHETPDGWESEDDDY